MRPSAVGPRLEKQPSENPPAPVSAIAPTVSADSAGRRRLDRAAPGPALPAAATTTMPAATAASTACEATSVPSPQPVGSPIERLMASMPYCVAVLDRPLDALRDQPEAALRVACRSP